MDENTQDVYRDLHYSSAPLEQRIVDSKSSLQDGQVKCPKCGATDIALNAKSGKLRCNFCRHEFEPLRSEGFVEDISTLHEEVIGSGAADIPADAETIVTMKCSSCGAEVVVDTTESTQARCHWCRNTLSVNQQIPNGAVPDMVLPFSTPRQQAKELIEQFVGKRLFYAHPKFKQEFSANNVMGIYLPYMIVDVNAVAHLSGQGEHTDREYYVTVRDSKGKSHQEKRYDVSTYHVERQFDLQIEGLTVESSADKLERGTSNRTNNIINSIMPFDTENCEEWNSNFLKGYNSEKRDVNLDDLRPRVDTQSGDIARYAALPSLDYYDRGVRWDEESLDVRGRQWRTAYLPVWLYSYLEKRDGEDMLHYVAVNGRTNETMGSVPINKPKLTFYSVLVEIFCFILKIMMDLTFMGDLTVFSDDDGDGGIRLTWALLVGGFFYYWYIYDKYRNPGARHAHERETANHAENMECVDNHIGKRTAETRGSMDGANSKTVKG